MMDPDDSPDGTPDAPPAAASEEAPPPPAEQTPPCPEDDGLDLPIMSVRRWTWFAWATGALGFLAAVVWLALAVPGFTVPFLTAFLIAYLLDPIVDRFEARRIPRSAAIAVLLVLFLVVGAGVAFAIVPQIVAQLQQIPDKLQALAENLPGWIEGTFGVAMPPTLQATADKLLTGLEMNKDSMMETAGSVAAWIYGGTAGALAFVVGLTLIPVFAFYLLRDFDRIVAWLDDQVPQHLRTPVRNRFREIDDVISAFVRGQLLVALILAVLYAIGLSIIGLPLALVVALVAGVGNIIPYVGTAVGIVLATLMALLDWQGWMVLVAVYGVFAGVQILEGWVITPRIVGDSVGLSPLVVIVSILIFGELFGFIGVLIAVPVTAVLLILLREILAQYRASEFYRAR